MGQNERSANVLERGKEIKHMGTRQQEKRQKEYYLEKQGRSHNSEGMISTSVPCSAWGSEVFLLLLASYAISTLPWIPSRSKDVLDRFQDTCWDTFASGHGCCQITILDYQIHFSFSNHAGDGKDAVNYPRARSEASFFRRALQCAGTCTLWAAGEGSPGSEENSPNAQLNPLTLSAVSLG